MSLRVFGETTSERNPQRVPGASDELSDCEKLKFPCGVDGAVVGPFEDALVDASERADAGFNVSFALIASGPAVPKRVYSHGTCGPGRDDINTSFCLQSH
mmetsp:Transcript_78836/g.219169  ORF Transcript_78836/g.219169 Transcript_78836/m.219169 type:complete len:100 (+) Transcript_78836:87-386(+)